MIRPGWKIFNASVIGKSHIDNDTSCQDASGYSMKQERLVAIVADGAGSGKYSAQGAQTCVDILSRNLLNSDFELNLQNSSLQITNSLKQVHTQIYALAHHSQAELRDYACTIVGIVIDHTDAIFFHIGDGMAIAEMLDGSTVVSQPENGEYSNETYFITDDDWEMHLRFQKFSGGFNRIGLMSDGAMSFVVNKLRTSFYHPFINPVTSFLSTIDIEEGNKALTATLADPRTWKITNDDKSLLLILPI